MRVVEYKTAIAADWAALDNEVNKYLSYGYQLYGSPYCGGGAGGFTVAQALIKHGLREPIPPMETVPGTVIAP